MSDMKSTVEYYDIIKISMFDGLITGREAYDILTKEYGCSDKRVTSDNVVMFKMVSNKFERIFVFIEDLDNAVGNAKKKEKEKEEKPKDSFLKGTNLLLKFLSSKEETLYG